MAKSESPKKVPRDDVGTRQVRVYDDIGEMISCIIRIEGGTTAGLLDPLIRASVVARHAQHSAAIEKIKAAEDALKKVEEEAKRQIGSIRKKKLE